MQFMMLITVLSICFTSAKSENKIKNRSDTLSYKEYKGKLLDKETNQLLAYASLTVEKTNISSISNSQGEFLIRVPRNVSGNILISYMGYRNIKLSLKNLNKNNNNIYLKAESLSLEEINVKPKHPEQIIKNILLNRRANYSDETNMLRGFYREVIKKNRHYVSLSEAVININKMSYSDTRNDRVELYKSRSAKNLKKMDTLLFKLQGGPTVALLLDIVKNPFNILSEDVLDLYNYEIINLIKQNGKLNYVIKFKQKQHVKTPLYYGLLYVESDTYALSSAKFSINLDNKQEVAKMFVKKKPSGVKISPVKLDYIVNYKEQDGKWYLNHARAQMVFKCKWKKKLFRSKFSITTDLAITDRNNAKYIKIKYADKFKKQDLMIEQISRFADDNFWGQNNVIKAEKSINSVIKKLKNKISL